MENISQYGYREKIGIRRMNKRIKELALEAGYQKDSFGVGHWDMPECKKFAELIVRECSRYIEDKFDFCGDEIIIAESVLKHFGVEE